MKYGIREICDVVFKAKTKKQWLISFKWDSPNSCGYGNMLQDYEPIYEDAIQDIKNHGKDKGLDLFDEKASVSIIAISKIKTRG